MARGHNALNLPGPCFTPPRRSSLRGSTTLILSPRLWIQIGITAFFISMVFLLWRREAGLRYTVRQLGFSPDFLTATWREDYEQWMWIERGGIRIGVYKLQLFRDPAEGFFDLDMQTRLNFRLFNVQMPIALDANLHMTPRLELDTFQGRLEIAGETIFAEAFADDLEMYYRVTGSEMFVAGGEIISRLTLKQPLMMADAILPLVAQNNRLRVGRRWATRASDPITGRFDIPVLVEVEARETITIRGQEIDAFRVIERAGETSTTSWYDDEGRLLRTDLGNGLLMTIATRDEVTARYPDLRFFPNLGDIDKERLRAEASQSEAVSSMNLLLWMQGM